MTFNQHWNSVVTESAVELKKVPGHLAVKLWKAKGTTGVVVAESANLISEGKQDHLAAAGADAGLPDSCAILGRLSAAFRIV